MDILDIYRNGQIIASIKPDDSSIQYKKVMGDNELRLTFSLNYQANLKYGDYIDAFGERYKINKMPAITKVSRFRYDYNLTMQGTYYDLSKVQYFFLGDDNTLKEPDFTLMGNGDTFIDLIISNLSRAGQTWTKGQVIPTVYKNITFSGATCLDALTSLASTFDTEFWIEGNTLHLTKMQNNTGQVFRQGKNKGLYEINLQLADDSALITRLYAFGADKNLPAGYRNYSSRLLIPAPDVYIEKNVDKYGVIESTQIFDDIYPHRTGKVTAVDAGNIFHFKDGDIDFDVNAQLLDGTSAKVTFNTGQLSGYTFDVSDFNNATKEFTILLNKNETAYENGIPNTDLKVAIGDEYVITDIEMPQSYIDAAEAELKSQAETILATYSDPVYTLTLTLDPVYIRSKRITPKIGQVVWVTDDDLQIDKAIRIITTSRNIVNEDNYDIELSDVVTVGVITGIKSSISDTATVLSGVAQQVNTDVLINKGIAVGDLTVKQGTVVLIDAATPPAGANLKQLVIDINTGKIYRQT